MLNRVKTSVCGGGGADLEKATSGASGTCGHFVRNHAVLRTFSIKPHILLTEDG